MVAFRLQSQLAMTFNSGLPAPSRHAPAGDCLAAQLVASHGAWHPIDPGHIVDVILVVDMQAGLMEGAPKHDLRGVIDRINRLTAMVRERSGKVVWIRHCGKPGDGFEPRTAGWAFLPELVRRDEDLVIEKTLNDPFAGTPLKETLDQLTPDRVLITGWATDFCVDATVRSAVSNGYHAVAVADGHTLSDRPHLDAASVIRHHNWVWSGLITNRSIAVMTTTQLLDGRQPSPWPKS